MELSSCLIVYFITVVLIAVVSYKIGKTIWSSLLISLVIGFVLLMIIEPPSSIDPWETGTESTSAIYLLIVFITPIFVLLFAFLTAIKHNRK